MTFMGLTALDQMVSFATEALASGDDVRISRLVRDLATEWPQEPALSISFALTSAASALEEILSEHQGPVNRAYRMAALAAADILAVEAMGQSPAKTENLLHFWRRVDPYFLKVAEARPS